MLRLIVDHVRYPSEDADAVERSLADLRHVAGIPDHPDIRLCSLIEPEVGMLVLQVGDLQPDIMAQLFHALDRDQGLWYVASRSPAALALFDNRRQDVLVPCAKAVEVFDSRTDTVLSGRTSQHYRQWTKEEQDYRKWESLGRLHLAGKLPGLSFRTYAALPQRQ